MSFSFTGKPSLQSTCQHVMRETLAHMRLAEALPEFRGIPHVAYELNDVRPIPRSSEVTGEGITGPKLADLFFIVNQHIEGYAVTAIYDSGMFQEEGINAFMLQWMESWATC